MTRAAVAVIAAAAVLVIAAPVRADDDKDKDEATTTGAVTPLPPYKPGKPDRWAVYGGEEANLEGTGIRSGFAFVAYLGPALQLSRSIEHATGTGGSFSFRLGRFADRDTIITLEVSGTVFPYKIVETVGMPPNETMVTHTRINSSVLVAFGAQTYVAPIFWVRAGLGAAAFSSRVEGAMRDSTANRFGVGGVVGAGFEIVRRKSLSLAVELLGTGAIYRTGLLVGGGLGLSLGVY